MKLLTTITAAVLVMAATGCETVEQKQARGLVRTQGGEWVPKGTRFFGSGHPMEMPKGGFAYDPTVFNQAMAAQQQAPQPVIVVGPDIPAPPWPHNPATAPSLPSSAAAAA
jgi:hypothetical protein